MHACPKPYVCMHACPKPNVYTLTMSTHSWIRDMEKRNLHLEEYCIKLGNPFDALYSRL